jgi:hypothetical protein
MCKAIAPPPHPGLGGGSGWLYCLKTFPHQFFQGFPPHKYPSANSRDRQPSLKNPGPDGDFSDRKVRQHFFDTD